MSSQLDIGGHRAEMVAEDAVEYHEGTDTYRTEYDAQTRPVTEAVVEAVAEATETSPLDLPQLHRVVDPDALDSLFSGRPLGPDHADGTVAFEFAGCTVSVNAHGTVEVREHADEIR